MQRSISIAYLGIHNAPIHYQASPETLINDTLAAKQGVLASSGALSVRTGKFTGRSPEDRFIVKDSTTEENVDWGKVNIAFDTTAFDALFAKVIAYLDTKTLYVRDAFACADPAQQLKIRTITETPWANLFANNLFIRPAEAELEGFTADWHIINAPSFEADAATDCTRQANFAIINFTKKIVLIGGTGYTGEIKKSIFSILNYILPQERGILSMHCSANIGVSGDTALFFGLSGTGKTTLSADPNRQLIGDDEHGWGDAGVFNFEGGCYAKCVDLTESKEPQIFKAIKRGAMLENIMFLEDGKTVDFADISITENTRVSYPIEHIENIVTPSVGASPKNIFFLTCDAYGVLPPISKLSTAQAMYHFLSGFTAKVAGTEVGVTEPKLTFSACFGAVFMPLHPTKYATLLGKKLDENEVNVWLVNTGWSGGQFGVGSRIQLNYTRALITAALSGSLTQVAYAKLPIFNLEYPTQCEGVPSEILNPKNTWASAENYDEKCIELAHKFNENFKKFENYASKSIVAAAPSVLQVTL